MGGTLAEKTRDKRISYQDLLKRLEIPEGTRTAKRCLCCGQDMHMVKVNKYVAFMVHTPEQQATCAASNPHNAGVPFIFSNKDYLLKILDVYYFEVTGCKPNHDSPY
jgi:hypothetical protein